MVEYTERLLAGWRSGEERDAHQEMMRLALQIVGKTLFGADVERDTQEVGKSLELLLEIAQISGAPSLCRIGYRRPRICG